MLGATLGARAAPTNRLGHGEVESVCAHAAPPVMGGNETSDAIGTSHIAPFGLDEVAVGLGPLGLEPVLAIEFPIDLEGAVPKAARWWPASVDPGSAIQQQFGRSVDPDHRFRPLVL
jgi:hypothetical protein